MAERKDHYKNNFPEAEGRANDEEQECRAEADAFERLRNEYNKTVKSWKTWRRVNPGSPEVNKGNSHDRNGRRWQRHLNGKCHLCMMFASQVEMTTRSLCRTHLGIVIQPTQWSSTASNRFLCTSTWLLIDCVSAVAGLSTDGHIVV